MRRKYACMPHIGFGKKPMWRGLWAKENFTAAFFVKKGFFLIGIVFRKYA